MKAETIKMQPWGFWYRNTPVRKNGNSFILFGKTVNTVDEATQTIDNAYLSLQKSIR